MQDRHEEITADENDIKQLQLHTHKVQAKSTCKFEAHDKKLACLGVGDYSGKRCRTIAERVAGNSSLSEGLFMCKGKKVIFTVSNHSESVTNRTGSTKQRSGLWIHLKRSYD